MRVISIITLLFIALTNIAFTANPAIIWGSGGYAENLASSGIKMLSGRVLDDDTTGISTDLTFSVGTDLYLPNYTQNSIPYIGASGLVSEDTTNFTWCDTEDGLALGAATCAGAVNGASVSATLVSHVNDGLTTKAEVAMSRHENTSASTGATLYGARTRGTQASPTVVQNGDTLLDLFALGYDGTDWAISSRIVFSVDNTPGNNDMPGNISFRTSADGSQLPSEKMSIDSTGQVQIPFTLNVTGQSTLVGGIDVNDISTIDATGASSALTVNHNGSGDSVTITQSGAGEALNISGGQLLIDENILMSGTGAIEVPDGTTAQRPGTPNAGALRFNTTTTAFEGYNGTGWGSLGGSPSFTTVTKTTTATLATSGEDNVLADATSGAFTITLPAASGNSGLTYKITKTDASANAVTIDGNASETIGGELTVTMASKDDSIIITTDGSNWYYLSDDVSYSARYTTDSEAVTSTSTIVIFEDSTSDGDTHNFYNSSTGIGTAPVSGWYDFKANIYSATVAWTFNQYMSLNLKVNTSTDKIYCSTRVQVTDTFALPVQCSQTIYLNKGDTFQWESIASRGATSLITSGAYNTMSVTRVK